jgi:hypothetical protein
MNIQKIKDAVTDVLIVVTAATLAKTAEKLLVDALKSAWKK